MTGSLLGIFEHGGPLGYYRSEQYRDFVLGGRFVLALVSLTLASFFINFVRQLNRMLGPGTLMNLLLGRYHRPVAEDRIFMFLDLNDSTAIAESLGPLRFNDFKNDFFYDVAEPVLQTRGQIYQYVGDEVVVTWTTERGLRQGNCLRCVFLVSERIHEHKDRYLAQYGLVPEFKAGLHGGPVVTAEIGDIKKDIVHSGDTVNTAARVEAQCRPLDRRVSGLRISAAAVSAAGGARDRRYGRARAPREIRRASALQRPRARLGRRLGRWRHSGCEGAAGVGCGVRGTTRRQVVLDRPWLGSTSWGARGNGRRERVHGPHTLPPPPPRNPGRELRRKGLAGLRGHSETVEREDRLLHGVDLAVDVVLYGAADVFGDRSRAVPELARLEAVLLDVWRERLWKLLASSTLLRMDQAMVQALATLRMS